MTTRVSVLRAVAEDRIGRAFSAFRLERVIGVGGITAVYAGVREDGTKGAVRVLHPDVAEMPEAVELFLEAAKDANRVGHDGAVPIIKRGKNDGDPYVVMALLESPSVAARFTMRGVRLRATDAARLSDAVLDVLGPAHQHGIPHGDVHPDNLVITPQGLRILDFGMPGVRRIAAANGVRAHVVPRAPDAWRGDEPNFAQDLAALGATMWSLITGQPMPAPGVVPPLPAGLVPREIAEIVQIALATTPERGFASVAEMRAALAAAQIKVSQSGFHAFDIPPNVAPAPRPSVTPAPAPQRSPTPTPAPQRSVTPAPAPQRSVTPAPAPQRAPTPAPRAPSRPPPQDDDSLEFDLDTAAPAPAPAPAPVPAPAPPRPAAPARARPSPDEPVGRDVTALRALFAGVARCVSSGAAAVAEALRFEAEALPPELDAGAPSAAAEEARAAREAARPETAKLLVRALETAEAAIAAGDGAITWQVTPRAFERHGHPVWQPHGGLEKLTALLAASGVRALGLRRGLMLPELGELLRLFAAVIDGDPRLDHDLAGVLWEAALPHVIVEADDDPLGPLDGDAGEDLRAERTVEVAVLRAWDEAAFAAAREREAGRGAAFAEKHERLMETLTLLPADAKRRAEAEAIFGTYGGDQAMAVPRGQALHVEDETRKAMIADLEADPVAEVERCGVTAARAYEANGAVATALHTAVDRLSRAEPLAALGLVHVACEAMKPAEKAGGGDPTFELAVDLGGASSPPSTDDDTEERRELARALVSPEALARIVTAEAPEVNIARHGPTPAMVMAGRVRDLVARLGDAYTEACLDAFPRVREPPVREALGHHLARGGDAMIAPVAALIPAVDVEPAIALVRVLVEIGTRAALDAVSAGVKSPHPLVRIEALSHLEGASSERLRVELNTLLQDRDPAVRLAALDLIAHNQIKVAGPHLALHAQAEKFDDLPLEERRAVLSTLYVLLPPRAEAICLEHVDKGTLLPRNAREETRELAAEMLGEIALAPEIEKALLEISVRRLRNTDRARAAARKAAQAIAHRRATGAPPGGSR